MTRYENLQTVLKLAMCFLCCCRILSVGGDGMFAEIVHGLLTNVLKASGFDSPSLDSILPQPKWRIGVIPAGMLKHHLFQMEIVLTLLALIILFSFANGNFCRYVL